jgi:dCTP deaminase
MILSNTDIVVALKDKRLIIDPLPEEDQIDSASIDLRIGEPLWVWNPALKEKALPIDVDQFNFKSLSEKHLVETAKEPSGKYAIKPQMVYLASTHEKIKLPVGSRLAGRIEGKSSLARLGLVVHMTAPTIHCGTGFGIIALEIYNHGPFSIEVTPGVSRICQLIIEEVSSEPEERIARIFSAQKNPKG